MRKLLFFALVAMLFVQAIWGAGDPEDPRVLLKLPKTELEVSRKEVEDSDWTKQILKARDFFDPKEDAFVIDLKRRDLNDLEHEGTAEDGKIWPYLKKIRKRRYPEVLLEREKKEQAAKKDGQRKKLLEKYQAGYDKRKKYTKEKKELLAKQKERLEKISDAALYLERNGNKQKITIDTINCSARLKHLLNSIASGFIEGKKNRIFNEEKDEVIVNLDEPLQHVKWAKKFRSPHLKVFIELCEDSNEDVQKTLSSIKRDALIPLVLFADFFQVTKWSDANHNPDRDVLNILLKELVKRIKNKDFLALPKKNKTLLWQIMDRLPKGVLDSLKKIAFPDKKDDKPVELEGHGSEIRNAVFLPNGKLLTVSLEKFRAWDLSSAESNICFDSFLKNNYPSHNMILLPSGKLVIDPGNYYLLVIDPIRNRNMLIHELKGHTSLINSFDYLNEKLASASKDKTIRIWNLKTGKEGKVLKGHKEPVKSLLWLSDNKLTSGDLSGKIYLWNLKTGEKEALEGHEDMISSFLLLPDERFASSSSDKTIRIWNPNKKKTENILMGHKGRIANLVLLPNNKIASFSRDTCDKTIRTWSPDKKEAERVLKGHTGRVTSLLLLPNDKIVSLSENEIIIWNLDLGKPERVIKKDGFKFSRFLYLLPDGRLVTASDKGTILLLNVLDIFGELSFNQSVLARLLQLNSMLPKNEKVAVFGNRRLREIFKSLPKKRQHLFARLGWLVK